MNIRSLQMPTYNKKTLTYYRLVFIKAANFLIFNDKFTLHDRSDFLIELFPYKGFP